MSLIAYFFVKIRVEDTRTVISRALLIDTAATHYDLVFVRTMTSSLPKLRSPAALKLFRIYSSRLY